MQKRPFLILAFVILLLAAPARAAPEVSITIAAQPDGRWRLVYETEISGRPFDLGPALSGRARDWRVETPGARLVQEDGRDWLIPAPRASQTEITVTPRPNDLAKDYESIAPLGEGAVIYTGHFLPWSDERRRSDTTFTIKGAAGQSVAAFGERAPRFEAWESPYRHPAFVYVGPQSPSDGAASAFIDPSAPGWIAEETQALLPALFAWFEREIGAPLDARPDFFLAMGAGGEAGRLRYDGDALPGQVMIRLSGGAWATPDAGARDLLRRATAHEAAHLWQARARPSARDAPAWIHEGAAEALAIEAIAGLGLMTAAEAGAARRSARAECAAELDGRTLDQAEAAGRWRAVYACGAGLARAAARGHNEAASVATFWRDFGPAAEASGGYDTALFLALVRSGDARRAEEIARFPHTSWADPARVLEDLADGVP